MQIARRQILSKVSKGAFWVAPAIVAINLPAHAQTSEPPPPVSTCSNDGMSTWKLLRQESTFNTRPADNMAMTTMELTVSGSDIMFDLRFMGNYFDDRLPDGQSLYIDVGYRQTGTYDPMTHTANITSCELLPEGPGNQGAAFCAVTPYQVGFNCGSDMLVYTETDTANNTSTFYFQRIS